MSGGFTVVPESLTDASGRMRGIAEQLGPAWQPVAQQTQSIPFGRGDDIVSPLIQVSLQGALAMVDSCIRSSTEALSDYADGLDSMAEVFASTEASTRTMIGPVE